MQKNEIKLTDLQDHVVIALRSNDYVSIWYNGIKVNQITTYNGGSASCKYRINTEKGQFRSDNPVIEFLSN